MMTTQQRPVCITGPTTLARCTRARSPSPIASSRQVSCTPASYPASRSFFFLSSLFGIPLRFSLLSLTGGKSASEPSAHGGGSRLGVEAVAATLHSITGELVLLGTSGEVLLCSVKEDSNDLAGHTEPTERSKQEADMKRKMSADRMDLSPSPPVGSASPLQLRRVKGKLRIQPITTCQGLVKEVLPFLASPSILDFSLTHSTHVATFFLIGASPEPTER